LAAALSFYLDEHVPPAVADGLRRRDIDVIAASEVGHTAIPDREHLAHAVSEGRVIVSGDGDYLRLHRTGVEHAGMVLLLRAELKGVAVSGLVQLHAELTAEEIEGLVRYI
jgi:predicted nuclease of predicted toxin-antitoxin system